MNRYFAVETKCGHVGKGKCIFIWFAVKAENGSTAATIARGYKRVKHHHKDAIRQVKEISFAEYNHLHLINSKDPYLHCKNIQQQRRVDNFEDRIEADEYIFFKQGKVKPKRDTSYLLKRNAIRVKDADRRIWEDCYWEIC